MARRSGPVGAFASAQAAGSRQQAAGKRAAAVHVHLVFHGAHGAVLVLLTFVPALSTWLPHLWGFK